MDLALLYSSPTEPVTLEQTKTFLAVDHNEHDTLITALIKAARQRAEDYCNRSFIEKRYVLALDKFPRKTTLKLPRGPVQSIVSVKYIDAAQTEQTLATDKYVLNQYSIPPSVVLKEHFNVSDQVNSLIIQYIAGYDKSDYTAENNTAPAFPFPEPVRTAILMMVRTMYDHRDDYVVGAAINQIPKHSEYLLKDYRIFEFM